jgi:3-carboxy-cis,cis-muconate cycloisomerase
LTSEALPPGSLFGPLFVPDALREALSDEAYLAAMLRFEAALAVAEARAGVIPQEAAEEIAAACDPARFDIAELGRAAVSSATPVVPLAKALREASSYAHWGATSQDALDTATMLIARDALALIRAELDGVAAAAARLAEERRDTVMAGRTLLQQALPVTFGLRRQAGWWRCSTHGGGCSPRRRQFSSGARPARWPLSATPGRRCLPGWRRSSASRNPTCPGTRRAGGSASWRARWR